MKKFYCDRCGEEITEALKILPSYAETISMEAKKELFILAQSLEKMDFCKECMAEIVDFARHKNSCDECVQQMMDESAMLQESDGETGHDTL
ncbi:MAG: hypothetical protein OSJ72_19285 [Lachnospiraceae bacterium]|nr:hypothetical protein [Lachnospiraceae bacterium]